MQKLTRDEMAQRVARDIPEALTSTSASACRPALPITCPPTKKCSCTAKTACWGWGRNRSPGKKIPS